MYLNHSFSPDHLQKNRILRIEKIIKAIFLLFTTLVSMTAMVGIISLAFDPSMGGNNFPFRAHIPSIISKRIHLLIFSVGVTWNAWLIVVHDCLIMALMNHICAQLMVLEFGLKAINSSKHNNKATVVAPKNQNQIAIAQLKFCVKHHQCIIRLRNEIETIFTGVLLIQFLTSMLIFGLTGFQATVRSEISGSDITLYAYCMCIFSELFIYCWFANQVLDQVSGKPGLLYLNKILICALIFHLCRVAHCR